MRKLFATLAIIAAVTFAFPPPVAAYWEWQCDELGFCQQVWICSHPANLRLTEFAYADFADGSTITRERQVCTYDNVVLACTRTVYCDVTCEAQNHYETLPCTP